jgi:hypothetical protein
VKIDYPTNLRLAQVNEAEMLCIRNIYTQIFKVVSCRPYPLNLCYNAVATLSEPSHNAFYRILEPTTPCLSYMYNALI